MSRFYLTREKIRDQSATLDGGELDHMKTVLRLKPGQSVILFDDEGWEHEAKIKSYGSRSADLEILRSTRPQRESSLEVVLAQAIGKGEKIDWVVEKATELGVQVIQPYFSAYTVPRFDASKAGDRRLRWERIALSAVKQSERTKIPEVREPCGFEELVQRPSSAELRLLFCPGDFNTGLHEIKTAQPQAASALLVVGPEGGLTSEEVLLAEKHGFRAVRLGKRILRTETAAVAALTAVQLLWGDLGGGAEDAKR